MNDRIGTFTFRLSCNCLVSFYLPPKVGVEVMCQECKGVATIQLKYPSLSSTCGAFGKDDSVLLRCTLARKHDGNHQDVPLGKDFTLKRKLRSSAEGNVGRA
jgi:hypothetical protein